MRDLHVIRESNHTPKKWKLNSFQIIPIQSQFNIFIEKTITFDFSAENLKPHSIPHISTRFIPSCIFLTTYCTFLPRFQSARSSANTDQFMQFGILLNI